MVLSRSWRTPWIWPGLSDRMVTWAPASLSAFAGSVSSDSSKPSVARTATRKPVSLDMMILLNLSVRVICSVGDLLRARGVHQNECRVHAKAPRPGALELFLATLPDSPLMQG